MIFALLSLVASNFAPIPEIPSPVQHTVYAAIDPGESEFDLIQDAKAARAQAIQAEMALKKAAAEHAFAQAAAAKAAATARAAAAAKAAAERRAAAARAEAAALAARIAAAKRWTSPIWGSYSVTSLFGYRHGSLHTGLDLGVPSGTLVHAVSSGTVIYAGWAASGYDWGYGYQVKIRHWDGTVTRYGHNSQLLVHVGQYVLPGQVISRSGSTGNSTGPHVHFEVMPYGGSPVNPRPWLAQKGVHI